MFVGSRNANLNGASIAAGGFSNVWLYAAQLRNRALLGEALTHEMTHQWLVNPVTYANTAHDPGGHCNNALGREQNMYNSRLTCVMDSALYGDLNNPETSDGVLAFHYVTGAFGVDSDYLRIRRRAEPVPQNERARLLPR